MSFKDSMTYDKLYKKYEGLLCYALKPWYKFVLTDKIYTTSGAQIVYWGAPDGVDTLLNLSGGINNPSTFNIRSTSTQDALGQIGASSVLITGTDTSTGFYQNETVNLSGTTAIRTQKTYGNILKMSVSNYGAKGTASGSFAATGTIYAEDVDNNKHITIAPGDTDSSTGYHYVSADSSIYISRIKIMIEADVRSEASLVWELWGSRMVIEDSKQISPVKIMSGIASNKKEYDHVFTEPLVFHDGTLISFVIRSVSTTLRASLNVEGYELPYTNNNQFLNAVSDYSEQSYLERQKKDYNKSKKGTHYTFTKHGKKYGKDRYGTK